jgi:hypothetical protein
MRKLGFAVVALVAFILGFIAGSFVVSRVAGRGIRLLTQGQPANLVTYVFLAARLRQADAQPVADFVEMQIDRNVLEVSGLPASQRSPGSPADKALRSAKLYRAVYPPSSDSAAEVNKVLDSVSADGPANNETMLRRLAAGKSGG